MKISVNQSKRGKVVVHSVSTVYPQSYEQRTALYTQQTYNYTVQACFYNYNTIRYGPHQLSYSKGQIHSDNVEEWIQPIWPAVNAMFYSNDLNNYF